MGKPINRVAKKRYLLDRAKILRPHHEFKRISEETLEHFPNQLSHPADQLLHRHPAKGTTIRP
jgi:hypothetical protein